MGSAETTTKNGVSKYLRIELRQTKPQLGTLATVIYHPQQLNRTSFTSKWSSWHLSLFVFLS